MQSKLAEPLFVINNPFAPRLSPELAKEIGLNESILFLQIEFWIRLPPAKEHDGKLWTYESVRDFQEQFPFWSIATINRTINRLIELELVFVGNYNKAKYDRTRWFALNPSGICKLQSVKWQGDDTRPAQNDTRPAQNETTIPETSTETKKIFKIIPTDTPNGDIEFADAQPRGKHSVATIAQALVEFERTGGKPEVSDAHLMVEQFIDKYSPVFAEILGNAEETKEDRRVVREVYKRNFDITRMEQRLDAYRNGDGAQFRKLSKKGDSPTSYWILNQLEKDLVRKLESAEPRVTSRGRDLSE